MNRRPLPFVIVLVLCAALTACGEHHPTAQASAAQRPRVVATTALIADLVSRVAGTDADVTTLIPAGADPHTYEPSLRDIRDVVYSDLAFSNYLMLEPHSIIKAVDANLPTSSRHVALAEAAPKYGATTISLIEDASLDAPWVGLRSIAAASSADPAARLGSVRIIGTSVSGPGKLSAFITETFGRPRVLINSGDGFDAASAYATDSTDLPVDAHTHVSWAFTAPGVYRLQLRAEFRPTPTAAPQPLGTTDIVFAVGVDPSTVPGRPQVARHGHLDIAAHLPRQQVGLAVDRERGPQEFHNPSQWVIHVPSTTLTSVPADPAFSFIDRPGTPAFILPQAVLGKHVHGNIDPHLWQDVRNVVAFVQVIRDELSRIHPARAAHYHRRAADYTEELRTLDSEMRAGIARIPPSRRHLITTDDAYRYLEKAYGLHVAGFVAPNPSVEPSVADRIRLASALTSLKVPAVFHEPVRRTRASALEVVAADHGVQVCSLLGHNFTREVRDYLSMMRFNLAELERCLRP